MRRVNLDHADAEPENLFDIGENIGAVAKARFPGTMRSPGNSFPDRRGSPCCAARCRTLPPAMDSISPGDFSRLVRSRQSLTHRVIHPR